MLLVIDVGNTNVVLGVFEKGRLIDSWRISTDKQKTVDEYGILIKQLFDYFGIDYKRVKDVILSSVVPPMTPILERMAKKYFNASPMIIGPGIKTSMSIKYDNPKEVGADRIVNAVAARELYKGALIIVDFGTATTFCAVAESGEYLGGAIAPGIGISMEALFAKAAKLPRIELVKPKSVIGKNTVTSMQSGIFYGFVGQVDGIIQRIKAEMSADVKVVATGGLADIVSKESQNIDVVNPNLTLEGLRIIYERNKGQSC